jgi:hypothetical protein
VRYDDLHSSYHKRGGTSISATDRWTHCVHKSGEDPLGQGDGPSLLCWAKTITSFSSIVIEYAPAHPNRALVAHTTNNLVLWKMNASMLESCDLVNIHTLKHGTCPPTHSSGSTQIYFFVISAAATQFIENCGILDFNTTFSGDHRPLYIDIGILRLLGYPVKGTMRALERDLQLNDPRLVDAYQASLIQQLINHNVGIRVDALYAVDLSIWFSHHETRFSAIDRDVERAMKCAANCCR